MAKHSIDSPGKSATKSTNDTVEFIGRMTGDGGCFCWAVTEEDYVKITGLNPDEFDRANGGGYRLYPSDVVQAIIGYETYQMTKTKKKRYKFKVQMVPVSE